MEHKQEYFFCYTKRLSEYLQEMGFNYITVAQDPKTKKIFSLYPITAELHKTIQAYKSR